jgi:hypothetical protein
MVRLKPEEMRRSNTELAEHAGTTRNHLGEFFSAGFAVSAFNAQL